MRRTAALLIVVVALAGCGEPGVSTGTPGDGDRLRHQADEALERWDAAVVAAGGPKSFVPIRQLTRQVGDWEEPVGDNHKQAMLAGLVEVAGTMPAAPAAPGTVSWADGRTEAVPLLGAEATVLRIVADARAGGATCPDCRPIKLTGARLTTGPVDTTRGPATAPVWEYTIEGTAVRLARLAVDVTKGISVVPPSWDPYNSPGGIAVESATTVAGSLELTAVFTGSPHPAREPCGVDYTASVVESAYAVVVIVRMRPHKGDELCPSIGATRTATARLAVPLGERAVLEVVQGTPVPVTIA